MLTGWTRLGAVGALALGGFLVVDSFGASSGAQSAPPVTIPYVGTDVAPDLSDDGNIVVFSSSDLDGVSTIVVHDRVTGTTTLIPGSIGGEHPTVSADGCTVGWTVAAVSDNQQVDPDPVPAPPTGSTTTTTTSTTTTTTTTEVVVPDADPDRVADVEPASFQAVGTDAALFVIDRCDTDAIATALVPGSPVAEFGPPALSADGAVVVASIGTEVLRFDRAIDGYALTASLVPPVEEPPLAVGADVDVSDDGSTVVFAAGPDLDAPIGFTVFRVDRVDAVDTVSLVATAAHDPSLSGDGSIVAYTALVTAPASSTVTIRENQLAPVALGSGVRPMISRDGNHVVHETADSLQLTSWTGGGPGAFAETDTLALTGPVVPTASGPAIDRFGRTVASDSIPVVDAGVDAEADIMLNTFTADAGFDSATYRLGSGDIGDELGTTVTFTNDGPASLGVASVAVDGTFVIGDETCSPVVRPGSTCTIDVGFTVEFLEEAFGTVSLVPLLGVIDPVPFTTEVRASGQAPPVETPTTTTPGSTTGGTTTGGTTTGGSTTGGSTTGGTRTTSTTGGTRTTSTTGGRTTTATTTTTVAPGSVVFSPTSFDFAPTIIEAGRRTGLVEIVNTTPDAATVVEVRLDPADTTAFEIVEAGCAGDAVPASGRCSVTVAFAPTTTGEQSVQLIASLDSGTEISATLGGVGAAPPTLTVFPGVARTGQVVTLRGAGFPTGLAVELTWSGTTSEVAVDDTGGFAIPVVVLPHTPSGPASASVDGQTDQFGDVTATVLVTTTTNRPQPGILDGVGPNISR